MAEALLAGEAESLTRKAVEMALDGNAAALKLCLERLIAPRREPAAALDLPQIRAAAELPEAMAALTAAVGRGALSASEAGALGRLLESLVHVSQASEMAARLERTEEVLARLTQS